MSSDPPPPYPGGPSAPLIEEKNGQPPISGSGPVTSGPTHGQPLPPEYGPPPYEATMQPGFVPPHVPGEGPMPMPHLHGKPATADVYLTESIFIMITLRVKQFGLRLVGTQSEARQRQNCTPTSSAGYHPPPGHFPQPMPGQFVPGPSHCGPTMAPTATVIGPPGTTTTVTVLQGEMFQSAPVQTVCPHCQQAIITRISHDVGLMNTLFCLFCFFVGCDLGCCLIPCLIDDLKDVTHTCPNCKGYIYTYKRIC